MQSSTGSDPNHYKFTGKERDTESNLDYFGARHYASSLGRFMTPDWSADPDPVPYADIQNPQTLNLYSYVQKRFLSSLHIAFWLSSMKVHRGCPQIVCMDLSQPTANN